MSWSDWRSEIAEACDGSHWTIDGIEDQIARGVLHILEPADCCLLVEVVDYPQARSCQVMWVAGDLESLLAADADLQAWALLQGCTEILAESRPAWGRALQRIGYAPWSVTSRKAIHGPLQ